MVLAAGAGTRFGPGGGKLLAVWRGRPLVEHVLVTLEAARDRGLVADGVVVHGPGGAVIRDLAVAHGFDAVQASRAELGLSESLKAGIVALEVLGDGGTERRRGGGSGALVCLGDQPRLDLAVIAALVAAAGETPTRLIRPRYRGDPSAPGHPTLIGRAHWSLVAETSGDRGLDPVLAEHGLGWRIVEVDGRNPDVDTPDDLAHLESD